MAGGVRHLAGGTLGLAELIQEGGEALEALEYELIGRGLRLRNVGSRKFNWRDLYVIIRHLPEDSAMHRRLAVIDEDSIWTPEMMVTAEVLDLVAYLVWFQTKDGQSGRNRPKPFPRPGHRPKKEDYAPLPTSEMLEWLGWTAPDDIGELEAVIEADERAEAGRTRTKLTEVDVRAIRADTSHSQAALAARHGVSRSTISAILNGRTWQHVN
ncbi:DUF5361 domain-containing protein [Arthrobacter sp. Soc17.1.1.1]|uniref:DUF5361 domain-containing protein n=1 Tax=Arthrobacter sp. Soc17.1.1.1 TaxID=3121277 RepID=UPI002FE46259